ncbi:MAG TPA: BatA domain-containing protein [Candidatus Wujingus californicus]|uniref:BatA domain-containing protein n=1 Tax=Candidatus Wujingus californicus TaxID=3367618 RepID=UPI0040285688
MISFFNPLLLFGILGISIPIIIHLINKKKAFSYKFAAIDFIFQTNKRISVKFKLLQLILLILRASLIAFLAIAFARPFLKTFSSGISGENVPTSNVIILDDSYSMQYTNNRDSFFKSAKAAAREIINNLTKDDEAVVITCSSSRLQALPELDYDKNNLLSSLDKLLPTYLSVHITSALDKSIEILNTSKASIKRVYLLTDMTKNSWDTDWFKTGNERLRNCVSSVHIIDLSEDKILKNLAITNVESSVVTSGTNVECRVNVTVSNFSSTKAKELVAQVFINQKKIAQGFFNIEANASETKEFCFNIERGINHAGWIEILKDNLSVDNKRYFVINTSQKLDVLLVDGDSKTNIYESETFYIEKALNPGLEHASLIKPTIISVHEFNNFELASFDIIFLCNVETLSLEKIQELEKFVKGGGSVIFSVGNKVDANYYNNSFGALLPNRLHTIKTFSSETAISEEQPLHLRPVERMHPILNILSETDVSTLSSSKFYRIFYVDPTPLGDCKTLLSFSDDTPAVIIRQIEGGKSVLFTSSIDRDWTDMPVKPFFLPLMQQLCKHLAGNVSEEILNEAMVDNTWQILCPNNINNVEITNPEGVKTILQPQLNYNEKSLSYVETHIPGIYMITVDGKPLPQFPEYFAVNLNTIESNLSKIDKKEIAALMGGINLTITSDINESGAVLLGEAKKTMWGTILFLTFCILIVEAFISRK